MAKKSRAKRAYKQKSIFSPISNFVVKNKALSAVFFTALLVFGIVSYTSLMRREGFPSVSANVAVGVGQYFVDDVEKVDQDVAQPLGAYLLDELEDEGITSIQTVADANTFQIIADLSSSITNSEANVLIEKTIADSGLLPETAGVEMFKIDAAKFLGEYDVLISVLANEGESIDEIKANADKLSEMLAADELVTVAESINPYTLNPSDETDRFQSTFSRAYDKSSGTYRQAVTVGVAGSGDENFDLFELDDALKAVLADFNAVDGQQAVITADITSDVTQQISSLQSNVLMGAIVVAAISALMISIRVSVLTSVFIVAVLVVTIGVMYLAGFTLNVITLFSLVLALGLFVDDATIIAESIYAKKDPNKKPLQVIRDAIDSIGTASFAGTLTTILVFSPLLFIPGVLGDFIYYIPVTVIISLLTSFLLSITLIPLLANYTILGDDKETREPNMVGEFLATMIEKLRTDTKTGVIWGTTLVTLSMGILIYGFSLFGQLGADNFPSARDGNNLVVTLQFPDGTTIEEAEEIGEEVGDRVATVLDENIKHSMFGLLSDGSPRLSNDQDAGIEVLLIPYQDRDVTSVELSSLIEEKFEDYTKAQIGTVATNGGPPEAEFPFLSQIDIIDSKEESIQIASQIQSFLQDREVELRNGDLINVSNTELGFVDNVVRVDGLQIVEVRAKFNAPGTTEATAALQEQVEQEFTDVRLASYSVGSDNVNFDFGQDSEFNESLSALFAASLIAIGSMIVLLIIQFIDLPAPGSKPLSYLGSVGTAFLKILLILVALPFSIFGVALGLHLTGNAVSFFVFVGLTGLIGIAVNNTILLVDNATHHQKMGMGPVGAIAQAMRERFRPLVTTTFTTIAALIPLALSDPFWEAMSATIIFGLASSTLLVILAFPYFYLLFPAIGRGVMILVKKIKERK